MKSRRHATILEIIGEKKLDTQEALLEELNAHGFSVTQATISRDIKELGLVKLKSKNCRYYYSHITNQQPGSTSDRYLRMLCSIIKVDYVRNMVVITTLTGSANAAAEALDSFQDDTVLGSIAGDNTILVIMRSDEDAVVFAARILALIE